MARDKAGPTWSDAEKINLFLEIANQVNPDPNWRAISVPAGRTKTQAQQLFNSMRSLIVPTEQGEPPLTSPSAKKRPREEASNPDPISDTPQVLSSSSAAAETPVTKRKRGRPTKAETEARRAAEARGEILPKPKPYVPRTPGPLVVGPDGQVKRRRGRPTKAETEARKVHEKEWKKKQQNEEPKVEETEQQQKPEQTKESEQAQEEEDEEEDEEDEEDE